MSDELSHFVISRKIDEGFEIETLGVKIYLRRIQGRRAYFYICAPKDVKITRILDLPSADSESTDGNSES